MKTKELSVDQWKELVGKFGEKKVAESLGITLKKLRSNYEETFSESVVRNLREKRLSKC